MTREQWALLILPVSLGLNWLLIREAIKTMREDVRAVRQALEGPNGMLSRVTRLEQWAQDRGMRRNVPITERL